MCASSRTRSAGCSHRSACVRSPTRSAAPIYCNVGKAKSGARRRSISLRFFALHTDVFDPMRNWSPKAASSACALRRMRNRSSPRAGSSSCATRSRTGIVPLEHGSAPRSRVASGGPHHRRRSARDSRELQGRASARSSATASSSSSSARRTTMSAREWAAGGSSSFRRPTMPVIRSCSATRCSTARQAASSSAQAVPASASPFGTRARRPSSKAPATTRAST